MVEEEIKFSDQIESRRGFWLTLFTVFLLAIVFVGMFFVIRKRTALERESAAVANKEEGGENIDKEQAKKTLLELATAPENSPDFKPNPELTALTTAPRNPSSKEISKINMDELTAPSGEN